MTLAPQPVTQTPPTLLAYSHLGLTVRDIEVSEAWYTKVLGMQRLYVEPHGTGAGYAVVMTRPGTGLFLGLDHHPEADHEVFDARRTGLDHFAIQVDTRETLEEWAAYLDGLGIEHAPISDTAGAHPFALFVVRDPDNIPVELFWLGG